VRPRGISNQAFRWRVRSAKRDEGTESFLPLGRDAESCVALISARLPDRHCSMFDVFERAHRWVMNTVHLARL
jgi:hypothetical protein